MKKLIPIFILIIPLFFITCKKPEIPLTSFAIIGDSTLIKGETHKYVISIQPAHATNATVAWSSSDYNILGIESDGTATAKNCGSVIIQAISTDGTNLIRTFKVYVLSKTQISILSVDSVTYYSARFSIHYDYGSIGSYSYGFYFDTVPQVDSIHNIGKYSAHYPDSIITLDLFDPNTKYYVKAFVKNKFTMAYSDSIIFQTTAQPAGLLGNYMLNIPLAYGNVAKFNDWIYYVNQNDHYTLYRIKSNLTSKQKLSSADEIYVYSVNIIGSSLYYGYGQSTIKYIIKSKPDGSKKNQVSVAGLQNGWIASFTPFQIKDDYLFYASSRVGYSYQTPDFCKIEKNGNNKTQLDARFSYNINLFNDQIYYASYIGAIDSAFSINVSNLDGSNKKELYRGYNFIPYSKPMAFYENMIFFMEGGKLKKIDVQNPSLIEIMPINPQNGYFNIINNTIFFSNVNDSQKLYKSDLEGLLVNKLCDDRVYKISVIDDWLYYYNVDDNKLYRIKQDGSGRQLVD